MAAPPADAGAPTASAVAASATAAAATPPPPALRPEEVVLRRLQQKFAAAYKSIFVDCLAWQIYVSARVQSSEVSSAEKQERDLAQQSPQSPIHDHHQLERHCDGEIIDGGELPMRVWESNARVVLAEGPAGGGKTTLCKKLCIDQQKFPNAILVFVTLADLRTELVQHKIGKARIASVDDLLRVCAPSTINAADRAAIVHPKSMVMWMLDGYDEVQFSKDPCIVDFLQNFVDAKARNEHTKPCNKSDYRPLIRKDDLVVVTSREERTTVANAHVNFDMPGYVEYWIVQRWSEDEVKKFCQSWFISTGINAMVAPVDDFAGVASAVVERALAAVDFADQVIDKFREANMEFFAGLPLFTTMVCQIGHAQRDLIKTLSPTSIFEEMAWHSWRRAEENRIAPRIEKREIVFDDELGAAVELSVATSKESLALFRRVMELASAAGYQQLVVTTAADASDGDVTAIHFASGTPPAWAKLLEAAGLLRFPEPHKARFIHRSFIEFFCARHIAMNPAVLSAPSPPSGKFVEWSGKFATVWVLLADYATRAAAAAAAAPSLSKITVDDVVSRIANLYFKIYKGIDLSDETQTIDDRARALCVSLLLRLTHHLPVDALFGAIRAHDLQTMPSYTPPHFLWLAEFSGREGALAALDWMQAHTIEMSGELLRNAVCHALDHQDRGTVRRFTDELVGKRGVKISLDNAMRAKSLVGVTMCLAEQQQQQQFELSWMRHLAACLTRKWWDGAAAFLRHPALRPTGPSEQRLFSVVTSRVLAPETKMLQVWDLASSSFRTESRDVLAKRFAARGVGVTVVVERAEAAERERLETFFGGPVTQPAEAADCGERLQKAAKDGDVGEVLGQLCAGVDVNAAYDDGKGWTALHRAAGQGHTFVVKLLLSHPSCNKDARNTGGTTALHEASYYDHTECTRELLAAGADVTVGSGGGRTALHTAARYGSVDVLRLLVAHPDFEKIRDERNISGETALHLAAEDGHTECARDLLAAGVNITATDNCGCTALHGAAKYSQVDVIHLLTAHADFAKILDVHNSDDWTALHCACFCMSGNAACVRVLLDAGADITVVDTLGNTALNFASYKGKTDVVRLLVAHIDYEKIRGNRNKDGKTAMDDAKTDEAKQLLSE